MCVCDGRVHIVTVVVVVVVVIILALVNDERSPLFAARWRVLHRGVGRRITAAGETCTAAAGGCGCLNMNLGELWWTALLLCAQIGSWNRRFGLHGMGGRSGDSTVRLSGFIGGGRMLTNIHRVWGWRRLQSLEGVADGSACSTACTAATTTVVVSRLPFRRVHVVLMLLVDVVNQLGCLSVYCSPNGPFFCCRMIYKLASSLLLQY